MKEVKYNENITLLPDRVAKNGIKLADNEFIVLMVTDERRGLSDDREFFDEKKKVGWV